MAKKCSSGRSIHRATDACEGLPANLSTMASTLVKFCKRKNQSGRGISRAREVSDKGQTTEKSAAPCLFMCGCFAENTFLCTVHPTAAAVPGTMSPVPWRHGLVNRPHLQMLGSSKTQMIRAFLWVYHRSGQAPIDAARGPTRLPASCAMVILN